MSARLAAAILGLALVIGVAAGYLLADRQPTARAPEASASRGSAPTGGAAGTSNVAPPRTLVDAAPAPDPTALPEPPATDATAARVARLAARERLSRKEVRRLVEGALAGKLADRELTTADYDHLVDAALRLRASLRVLRGVEPREVDAAVLAAQRETLLSALADFETITGVPPSDLGAVMAPDDDPESPGHAR